MSFWKNVRDDSTREAILNRIRSLNPDSPRQWGKMTAPQMIAHLSDQMRHTMGDVPVTTKPGALRLAPVRFLAIYVLAWPKGRVQGPPEAFVTKPGSWEADIAGLVRIVERFAEQDESAQWPDHILFGHMTGRDWGVFIHKHFDHHLRQFGV